MRHAVRGRILNRTPSHRLALRRNMVQSLIEHGEIRTTVIKAKEMRPLAEKVIQLAVDAAIAAESGEKEGKIRAYALRQRAIQMLNDRQIIPAEHRETYDAMSPKERNRVLRARTGRRYRAAVELPGGKFTSESVIHRLFAKVGPAMKSRNEAKGCCGGYTRVIKLANRRLGDGGQIGILQLVGEQDGPRAKGSSRTNRSRKAQVRYAAFAGKAVQRRGKAKKAAAEESAE